MTAIMPEVTIYFFSNNTYNTLHFVDYIDVVNDISSGRGINITWRRLGQPVPNGMVPVTTFSAKDAQEGNIADIAEALIEKIGQDLLRVSDGIRAVEKIHAGIRRAMQTGEDWGYVHSKQYNKLVEDGRILSEEMESGPLSAWEAELLGYTPSTI